MENSTGGPRRKIYPFLIVVNLIIVSIGVGILLVASRGYQVQVRAVVDDESRFVTTEWQVLRELKIQTDRQLLQKDREISELRQRYLLMTRQGGDSEELREIERRLQEAEDERQVILSKSLELTVADEPAVGENDFEDVSGIDAEPEIEERLSFRTIQQDLQQLIQPDEGSSIMQLLQDRIHTLESQLTETRLESNTYRQEIADQGRAMARLEMELARVESALSTSEQELMAAEQELVAAEQELVAAEKELVAAEQELVAAEQGQEAARQEQSAAVLEFAAGLRREVEDAVSRLDAEDADGAGPQGSGLTVDDVETQLLVMAIADSPEISSEHPDLRRRIDAYHRRLEAHGRQVGRADALKAARDELADILLHLEGFFERGADSAEKENRSSSGEASESARGADSATE